METKQKQGQNDERMIIRILSQYTEESKRIKPKTISNYVGEIIGTGLAFSMKYIIPFSAGFYVGGMDGNNIEIDPMLKCTLLTAPTTIKVGLNTLSNSFVKTIGKVSLKKEVRDKIFKENAVENHPKIQKKFEKLEDIAKTNVIKKVAKSAIKPGVATIVGYTLGYGLAKLS